ncbi:MAG: DUF6259 domain-containing protein [Prevotellaceae bacterium]|nr:DUF6259 domain-containing protein [Prevotellaceae bacterium]
MKRLIVIIMVFVFGCGTMPAQERITMKKGDKIYAPTACFTEDSVFLQNKNIELVFSNKNTYKMYGMKFNSRQMAPVDGFNTHPWEITYRGADGKNHTMTPEQAHYKGVEKRDSKNKSITLIFTWEIPLTADKKHAVRMLITLSKNSDLIEWDIEADLPENWIISGLNFPRIAVCRPQNSKLILSAGWGAEYILEPSTSLSSRYPSASGAMQLVLMHNDNECFYYSTKDLGASDKTYQINCSGNNTVFYTGITTSEEWSHKNKGAFRLPWTTVTGYCFGEWETAVTQWYKPFTYTTEWGRKTLSSHNSPKWIYEADVWIRPTGVNNNVMEAVREAIKILGKGVGLHWYVWHHHPFDTKYPEYFPPKKGFTAMVAETQKLGGYVIPYINGRLWDSATTSYRTMNGKEVSCLKSDGTPYIEIYGSKVPNTVSCPASAIWQNIQKDLIWKIQDEIGTAGVYIDQIAAAPSNPCWADNHGHAKGGGEFWVRAYRDLMTDIRTNHLKKGNILTTEENAECYIDLFDMLLMVNSPIRKSNLVPLFPLVYSDRVITSAFTYTPADLTNGSFRYLNMMSLLWGAQLGWIDPIALTKENAKEEIEFFKKMMLFRKQQHQFFNGGHFLKEIIPSGDNPEKQFHNYAKSPVVRGAEWKKRRGNKKVLFLVNIDDIKHTVSLPSGKQITIDAKDCMRIDL